MDNDNFVTEEFFEDLFEKADGMSSGKISGVFFKHPQCQATTGRIACGLAVYRACGGYDEQLEPLGYEDSSWPCAASAAAAYLLLLTCCF